MQCPLVPPTPLKTPTRPLSLGFDPTPSGGPAAPPGPGREHPHVPRAPVHSFRCTLSPIAVLSPSTLHWPSLSPVRFSHSMEISSPKSRASRSTEAPPAAHTALGIERGTELVFVESTGGLNGHHGHHQVSPLVREPEESGPSMIVWQSLESLPVFSRTRLYPTELWPKRGWAAGVFGAGRPALLSRG